MPPPIHAFPQGVDDGVGSSVFSLATSTIALIAEITGRSASDSSPEVPRSDHMTTPVRVNTTDAEDFDDQIVNESFRASPFARPSCTPRLGDASRTVEDDSDSSNLITHVGANVCTVRTIRKLDQDSYFISSDSAAVRHRLGSVNVFSILSGHLPFSCFSCCHFRPSFILSIKPILLTSLVFSILSSYCTKSSS